MTAMINTVIFDMDGLMFDTETLYIDVFEDVCKKHGHAFPREYFLGMLGTSHFDYSIYHKDYPWLEDMLKIADDEFVSYYEKRFAIPGSANKYGLKELHDYLKSNNYNICIASSSSVPHIKRLVNNCGFDFKADLMLSSQDEYASKPAPDLFLACAKEMDVEPKNCLVLEDSKNGIRAAYNANMHRIWIPDQVQFNEEDMKYVELQCENFNPNFSGNKSKTFKVIAGTKFGEYFTDKIQKEIEQNRQKREKKERK